MRPRQTTDPRHEEHSSDPGRYHAEIDLQNHNSSHTQLILLTGRERRVLEVGTARGLIARLLQERGCQVTGIEIDPEAAEVAARYCDRMIVGDVERLDLPATFGGERFDVMIFGDVLEHLIDPSRVLTEAAKVLAPGGRVLASIPNVAHASVRLALLLGRFRYTESGLLDTTHLRFFTREGVAELFARAGYEIRTWGQVTMEPFATEVPLREDELPALVVEAVREEPDALTYQFVVEAVPRPASQSASIGAEPPHGERLALLRSIPEPDAELRERLARMRTEMEQRVSQISEKDAAIEVRDKELRALRSKRSVRAALAISRFLHRFVPRRKPGG